MRDSKHPAPVKEAVNVGPAPADRSSRSDGRRQMLVYLPPHLIKALKTRALHEDKHAYELVEKAVEKFLEEAK